MFGESAEFGTMMKVSDSQWNEEDPTSVDEASLNNAISYYWESKGL